MAGSIRLSDACTKISRIISNNRDQLRTTPAPTPELSIDAVVNHHMVTVEVLSTGGTIASTAGTKGATPDTRGEELIAAVPGVGEIADVSVSEVTQKASFDMDPGTVATIGRAAIDAAEAGVHGIVVTHGTDTMEESAYYLDLALSGSRGLDVPIVFTGAQRRSDEVSPDGPSNLLTAVRAASDERVREAGGVYVALNEELHSARTVTKTHTSKLETFGSPGYGPAATITRDRVVVAGRLGSRSVDIPALDTDRTVWVIQSGCGVGAAQLETARAADVDGVVVEGTGLGNTTDAIGAAVEEIVSDGVPVVVTSRCHAGRTAPVYGTPGGGATLRRYGAIGGGDLPAHKARIKLMLALAYTDDPEEVRALFESPIDRQGE